MTENRKPHSVTIRSTDLDQVDWSELVKAIAREIAEKHIRSIEKEQRSSLDLRRKISVRQAAELNDIHEDTFRRRYPHLIKKISERRDAVELGDAIAVGEPKT